MNVKPTAKRGRPSKPYRTSWGEHIPGLRRKGDRRWVISATEKEFREADERVAVARFKRWQAGQDSPTVTINLPVADLGDNHQSVIASVLESGGSVGGHLDGSYSVGMDAAEPMLWAWMREQIISHPEHAATMTGIPELARLADLPKPEPSPTLKAVGDLYQDKADVTEHQRRRQKRFWDDFAKAIDKQGVATLRQLTATVVADYGDQVKASGHSPKYVKHRFTGIRGILNFARKRGVSPNDIRHALDCCAVLTVARTNGSKDPHPISREDFHTLLGAATDERMKALLLTMLNLCMYPGEATGLDCGDLDLTRKTVATRRSKTGVVRIGILWDRTIEALKALRPPKPLDSAPVFLSKHGTRWSLNKEFRRLRKLAGVADAVKAEDCRDGAYTEAIESGAELMQAKLLAGHATGISDHYAKRRPTMVADACAAIERAYFDQAVPPG